MIKIYTDGGARGNPGPAGIGVYITDELGNALCGFGEKIGRATNNVAEYEAVNASLAWLIENKDVLDGHTEIRVFLDSLLLVSQINGVYKVKNNTLKELFFALKEKEHKLSLPIRYFHIPREKNIQADAFVNRALDQA